MITRAFMSRPAWRSLGNCWLLLPLILGIGQAQAEPPFPVMEMRLAFPELVLRRPLWLGEAPDASGRLFIMEQPGRILILPRDRTGTNTILFLDISDRKPHGGNEEGLLGLAFHPQFKTSGKFYIYYTGHNPRRSVLSEFQVSKTDPNLADSASERVLLEIPQPYENHNGGATVFGPDGYLYLSLGDGGAANDPHNFGQNLNTFLGKIIRIDVNARTGDQPYGIPGDNPFAGKGGGVREEIWAYGLRNVWRMSFDRQTGELWAGDVGQNKWEEVDIITKGGNYGWNYREGFHPFTNSPPAELRMIEPVIEYPHIPALDTNHLPGLSITGGYVYRGQKNPGLRGVYLYADWTMGTVWGLRHQEGKVTARGVVFRQPKGLLPLRNIASFGEDASGEVYLLVYEGTVNGRIYELMETKPESATSREAGSLKQ